jgi:hypothetical protein
LGPGEPKQNDLLRFRRAKDYANDEDWPFNWFVIAHVARSVRSRVRHDLEPSPYRGPLTDETREILQYVEAGANRWLERSGRLPSLESVDAEAKAAFRAWWAGVASNYEEMKGRVSVYPHQIPEDLGNAINHTIRYMAAHDERALASAPGKYVANLERQNHWKTPSVDDGQRRFFSTSIHQISGFGSSWQDAPIEHRDDVLLLQIQGDLAFFNWHGDTGCMLHFWIDPDALSELDFSEVEATLECD